MRFILNRRMGDQIEFGIIYGGIALLALFAGWFLPVFALAPSCVFKSLTGVPCPTCGATRSIVFLSQGDFVSAFTMNPLIAACALSAVIYLPYSFFTLVFNRPRIGVALSEKEKDRIRTTILLLVLVNWLYLVITL
jgi:hypothetical protein